MTKESKTEPRRGGMPKAVKWVIGIVVAIVLLIVVLVIAVPFYVSSNSGKEMIVGKINESIDGRLKIADLSMGWFSGITASDVVFVDNRGSAAVTVKSFYTEPKYGSIMMGNMAFGRTVIDEPVVSVDLAKMEQARPQERPEQRPAPEPKREEEPKRLPVKKIDLVINKGDVKVTDSSGKVPSVELANINSKVNLRPIGELTTFSLNLLAANNPVSANGEVRPSSEHGWKLVGTSGNVRIDVNELNLNSLGGIFAMIDPKMTAKGIIRINGVAKLNNGVFEQLNAKIRGSDINIKLPQLKGDTFITKKLDGNIVLASSGNLTKIDTFNLMTDWANINVTGVLPQDIKSMQDILSPESAAVLKGNMQVNVAAVMNMMPNTAGLKPGTKINTGNLKADINTETAGGQKVLAGRAEISNLNGIVNGKPASLNAPITLDGRIAGDKNTFKIEQLNMNSSFAKANVSGNMEAMKYAIESDLARMQSDLGQFVSFGEYKLAGQMKANGDVSIKGNTIASAGQAQVKQLAVARKDGTSASEPAANIVYNVVVNQDANQIKVNTLNVDGSFLKAKVNNATVPMAAGGPMDLKASASVDIGKAMPWAIVLGNLQKGTSFTGMLNSNLVVSSKGNEYHIVTEDTRINNLTVISQGKPPFSQEKINIIADLFVNPVEKTYRIKDMKITSPAVNIQLEKLSQTNKNGNTTLQGTVRAKYDLAAVTTMAAPFMPEGLTMAGNRDDVIIFDSTWPTNKPELMMANMTANAGFGFQSAEYMGLVMGPTDVKLNIKSGLMTIQPFKTTCNNGTLQFAGSADFRKRPTLLVTPGPMDVVNNVQINDKVAAALLKNVNPIFASSKNARGAANLSCRELAIPLAGGNENDVRLDATVSVSDLYLQSPLLSVLGGLLGKLSSNVNTNAPMGLQPTRFTMQNGVLQYNNMQVNISGLSLTFSGQMGPGENMNLSVILPGGIGVALKGTKSKPGIDEAKTLQIILQEQIKRGLLGGKGQKGTQQQGQQQGQGGLFGLPIPGLPDGQQQQAAPQEQPQQQSPQQQPTDKQQRRQQRQQQVEDALRGIFGR